MPVKGKHDLTEDEISSQQDMLQDIDMPREHFFSKSTKIGMACGMGICVTAMEEFENWAAITEPLTDNLYFHASSVTLGVEAGILMAAGYYASNLASDFVLRTCTGKSAMHHPGLRVGILLLGMGFTMGKLAPIMYHKTENYFRPFLQTDAERDFENRKAHLEEKKKAAHWRDGFAPQPR